MENIEKSLQKFKFYTKLRMTRIKNIMDRAIAPPHGTNRHIALLEPGTLSVSGTYEKW